MIFEHALHAHLIAEPTNGILERHALHVLEAPVSPHRTRLLARWEKMSRDAIHFDGIDWSTVDWLKVIQIVLSILMMFLMFAEPAPEMMGAFGAEASGWFLGKQALLAMMPTIIENVGLPWIQEIVDDVQRRVAELPIGMTYSSDKMKAYLLEKLNASQEA